MAVPGCLGDKVNNNNDKLWTLSTLQGSGSSHWAVWLGRHRQKILSFKFEVYGQLESLSVPKN